MFVGYFFQSLLLVIGAVLIWLGMGPRLALVIAIGIVLRGSRGVSGAISATSGRN